MIWEARFGFVLFFFLCWCVVGLMPWAASAVLVRGRGSLFALPLALAAACAAGVLVPLLGQRDVTGFFLSLITAILGGLAGSIGGLAFDRRLQRDLPPTQTPEVAHKLGSRRPDPPASNTQPPPS